MEFCRRSATFLLLLLLHCRFLRGQRRAVVYTNLITHVAYCINKIIYNLHCKCPMRECEWDWQGWFNGEKYEYLLSSISIRMRDAWILYMCGLDAFMPTDFNINLLRRHVILTTYFVHTIAIVTQHAAAAVMRKNIIKCVVVRNGVHIILYRNARRQANDQNENKSRNI